MNIVDVHTHIFPDFLAKRAIGGLSSGIHKPNTDGTLNGLLSSMDNAGIKKAFIANIATKIEQFFPIMKFSEEIRSERIIPLISIHPDDPAKIDRLDMVKKAGFIGIKLHPMYQGFVADDTKMFEFYEHCADLGLFILIHAGNDTAFPGSDYAAPYRVANIINNFKNLKLIAAHLGGYEVVDDVLECICGKQIYIDTSFIHTAERSKVVNLLNNHDENLVLFGSDSPWNDQKGQIEYLSSYNLSTMQLEKILYKNAEVLIKESL